MPSQSTRAFLVLCAAAVAIAVGYVVWTSDRSSAPAATQEASTTETSPLPAGTPPVTTPETPTSTGTAPPPSTGDTIPATPHTAPPSRVFFRDTGLGSTHGRLVEQSLAAGGKRRTADVACERVHFAAGHGVCLTADRGFVTVYGGFTFDESLKPIHRFSLVGVPSRVRVSPDGQRAGFTVFVSGDSYAPGSFSTRTTVMDVASGESLGDLEQYAVTKDGEPFKAIDFNFWGVTFFDDSHVYATLGTGGRTYLIEADVEAKHATVLHENVECPSLSPDGTRIAFKKRMPGARLVWRLHVLDLKTRQETALAEMRSVDDQAEWLDSSTVTYALPSEAKPGSTDVWSVKADGSGKPEKLVTGAWSPAVVRPGKSPTS